MNNEKHIALLIDIDNVDVSMDNFNEIISILKEHGTLDYIKLYGYNERRHTNWGELIAFRGIDTCSTMRFRKRNKSQIDLRLIVDAMSINYTKPNINTFCLITGKGDLVPLLASLRLSGKYLMDVMSFSSDMNGHLFNERLLLESEVDPVKLRKNKISAQFQQFSERTAAMAMEDSVDNSEKDKLIADVEKAISDMEDEGQGIASDDPEEKELFQGLKNILEILKSF